MREPVKGSVAIGQLDYQYPFDNTAEGYEASASLQMPGLTLNEQIEGERLFGIYCAVCHGEKGGNDGTVASKQASMKPSWANYQDKYVKELPVGKIYHTITYGKNNMGSYASAVTPKDRWAIIAYVKRLSMMDSLGNMPKAVYIESAPVAAAVVPDTAKNPVPAIPANSSSSTSNHSNHNKH
jgi:mono/diheme cytochrome c family protein